jgi:hypothetical protein
VNRRRFLRLAGAAIAAVPLVASVTPVEAVVPADSSLGGVAVGQLEVGPFLTFRNDLDTGVFFDGQVDRLAVNGRDLGPIPPEPKFFGAPPVYDNMADLRQLAELYKSGLVSWREYRERVLAP